MHSGADNVAATPTIRLLMRGEAETVAVGECIGRWARAADVLALTGPLGAGKTWLTKGIARGLGVEPEVNSPTFILVNEYEGRLRLYHIDAYRMSGANDLFALGSEEMFSSGAVVVIEWADRVAEALPRDHLLIQLQHAGAEARTAVLCARGFGWRGRVDTLRRELDAYVA